jgi:hypothetical protein
MPFITSAEAHIHAQVEGVNHLPKIKSWSSFEGGDMQASTTQIFPGGLEPAVAAPGPKKRTNVTVRRPYHSALHPHLRHLEHQINKAMHASFTPIDADGNAVGDPIVRHGILKEVTVPNFDAKGVDHVELALVMECTH